MTAGSPCEPSRPSLPATAERRRVPTGPSGPTPQARPASAGARAGCGCRVASPQARSGVEPPAAPKTHPGPCAASAAALPALASASARATRPGAARRRRPAGLGGQLLQPAMNEPARGRARPRPGPAPRRPGFPEAALGGPGGHAAAGTRAALCKVPRGAGPGSANRAGQGGGRPRSAAAPAEPLARPGVGGAARPRPASGVGGAGRVSRPCLGAPPKAPGTWRVAGSQVTRRASPGPCALPRRGAATLTSHSEGPAPFAALADTIELPARRRRPRRSGRGGQSSSRPQAARAAQTGRPPAGHRAAPPPLRRALPLRAGWGEEGSSLHPLPRSGRARGQSSRTRSRQRRRLGAPAGPPPSPGQHARVCPQAQPASVTNFHPLPPSYF